MAQELRRFMAGESADEAAVLSLMERHGELDGKIVYRYARRFAEVGQSVTAEQMAVAQTCARRWFRRDQQRQVRI